MSKWLYGSFLLASVFCHLARMVKMDALKNPEVRLFPSCGRGRKRIV
jgi:hypothetical protein